MAVSTAQVGDLCIATQVVPASQSQAPEPGVEGLPAGHSVRRLEHAKALSPILILIGLMQLSVGASLSASEMTPIALVVRSGVYLWGGLGFIVTGVATVILTTKESILRVKACLVSHGINAAVALLSILLYSLQLYTEAQSCWVNTNMRSESNICSPRNSTEEHDHHYNYNGDNIKHVVPLRQAFTSLILLYIVVGFIVSICVIILRYKALKAFKYTLL